MYAKPAVDASAMTERNPRKGRELVEGFDPKRWADDFGNARHWH